MNMRIDEELIEMVADLSPTEMIILEMAVSDLKSGREMKTPEEYYKELSEADETG